MLFGFWKKIERFEVDAETLYHADLFYEIPPIGQG